jgi:uncharacterized protein DUF1194
MRRAPLVAAIAAAGLAALVAASLNSGSAAPPIGVVPADFPGSPKAGSMGVDVELVIAVDISYSMDPEEQALQRDGYIEGLTSPEFLNALRQGMHGRIAVTYLEWAGSAEQRILVPWRLVDGAESARALAEEIARAPYRRAFRTSISGALLFSTPLFEGNGYSGIRRVIDVSGDGTNNQGPLVTLTRDDVLAKGITINGLPIMLKRPNAATLDIENLDVYYEDCVIGGAGAFVIPIRERSEFRKATRTKLVLEIAGLTPEPRVIPAAANAPRISCTIGERMWQDRWGGGGIDLR